MKEKSDYLLTGAADLKYQYQAILNIPSGFAHGFVAFTEVVHLLYNCTNEYYLQADAGIRWNDPDIAITWPVDNPIVSDKDRDLPIALSADFD